jgi:hypothetical protein
MSTFRTPSVRVYQELLTTNPSITTPFFDLCIVGPVYQVEENVKVNDYTLSTENYTSKYVNQMLGSIIDPASVSISLSDVYVKVWPKTSTVLNSAVVVSNSSPVTVVNGTPSLEFSDAVVKAGDFIDITYKTAAEELTYSSSIQTVSEDGKTITLKRNLPNPDSGATVTAVIKRPTNETHILESQFVKADKAGFTILAGAQVATEVLETAATVVSATTKVSYRALRTDIANDFMTITSQSVATAKIGSLNINNPMSVAARLVSAAVSDMSYRILPIESDDNNGYIKALDILSTNEKIYVIVPLTQDKDVISAYASHCATMSKPEKSMWRTMFGSGPMPSTKVMIEINEGSLVAGLNADSCYLKDIANGMFVSSGARVTDFMDVYDTKNEYQYSLQLTEILNDSVASFSTMKWQRTSEGYVETEEKLTVASATSVNYEIVRVLDTQGVADAIGAIAKSYSNKRLHYVMPDTIMLNVNSVDVMVPSYYLCVTLGAMRAGYPPHQGFSTISLSGIKRVLRANKLFTKDQLDEMAGQGVFWVLQDEPEELPYVLYQTTTDTTQLETCESSCVAVVDYASKYYKDNLKPVLGKYNVNNISVTLVKNVINSCTTDMTGTSYQYIGPILLGGTLVSVETKADTIKPTIKIEIPYPVNAVDVVLQV